MAVDDYDPITGHPIFLDGGAMDDAVDSTAVATYAAEVGHVISGTTAYRNAYPYARKGLLCSNETTGAIDMHNGTGWVEKINDTGWVNLTLASGATVSGSLTPQVRKINGVTYLRGRVTQSVDALFIVPPGFRSSQELRFAVMTGSTGSTPGVLVVQTTGNCFTAAGATVNLAGPAWPADS